jgi:carbon starvation protein
MISSIAGDGPLVGTVLAAQFGFMPGFLWMLAGSVMAGAVHDFIILTASVQHDVRIC